MPHKVLIVDNSLFMRSLISTMLAEDPDIKVVGTANSGKDALAKMPKLQPDVITLDLAMEGWDGLRTLQEIMERRPTPVIIVSAHSKEGAKVTMQCLAAGAVSTVLKPSGELSLDIDTIQEQLISQIKSAATVPRARIKQLRRGPKRLTHIFAQINSVIVIGASTGGPQTLGAILPELPADFPFPVVVVQHVPSIYFTQALADRLNEDCVLTVKVAERGDHLRKGTITLVPGGFDMRLSSVAGEPTIVLVSASSKTLTPSVDSTMKTLAKRYAQGTVGVILTGMGHDGLEGMRAIKQSGGKTIAQDKTALIYGMSREVIEAGLADRVAPAEEISAAILASVSSEARVS